MARFSPSTLNLGAAEWAMLKQVAEEALTTARDHQRAHLCFHGFEVNAEHRGEQPRGVAIALTVARHGRVLAEDTLLWPYA